MRKENYDEMAGRSLKMARTATELEDQAFCLSAEVFFATPKNYIDKPIDHPVCQAWRSAVKATMLASIATERLADMLRAKAGITGPGPVQEFLGEQADSEDERSSALKSNGASSDR